MADKTGTKVLADLEGTVCAILVTPGAAVRHGGELVVLETMKMEMPVEAPRDGTVTEFLATEGRRFQEGDALVLIS